MTLNQDMQWRAAESARIEQQLRVATTPEHCGGDCGDCQWHTPTPQPAPPVITEA